MAKKKIKKSSKQKEQPFIKEWKDRAPILKFTGAFIAATIAFFLATNAPWFDVIRGPLLNIYTLVSSVVLNIFGFGTTATGDILSSARFSVNIEEGCDAVAPAILYAVSVLVFPMAWQWKWRGLLYGLIAIFVLNLFRILTLFITGVYARSLFDLMHVEVWQVLFIISTVFIWLYWLKWATKKSAAYAKA